MENDTKSLIHVIGEQMVKDEAYRNYSDISWNPKEGILPRGLIFEDTGRNISAQGCVVCGLNPGPARRKEILYYQSHSQTYDMLLEYWTSELGYKHPYFTRLRELVGTLNIEGPILWTDLVKCQSTEKKGRLLVQTVRDDINRYLFKEIELLPKEWPLIGVGAKAFEILSYRFPDRLVIGVPHATGSYGHFHKIFSEGKLKKGEEVSEAIKKISPIAISLSN